MHKSDRVAAWISRKYTKGKARRSKQGRVIRPTRRAAAAGAWGLPTHYVQVAYAQDKHHGAVDAAGACRSSAKGQSLSIGSAAAIAGRRRRGRSRVAAANCEWRRQAGATPRHQEARATAHL